MFSLSLCLSLSFTKNTCPASLRDRNYGSGMLVAAAVGGAAAVSGRADPGA